MGSFLMITSTLTPYDSVNVILDTILVQKMCKKWTFSVHVCGDNAHHIVSILNVHPLTMYNDTEPT